MKILYSGVIDKNHSKNGGYHHIIENPLSTHVLLGNDCVFGKLDVKYHLRKLTYLMLDIKTRISRKKHDITHLFYGELTMSPFFKYKRKANNKIVATIHLDLEKQNLSKYYIKNLRSFDGVIVLSSQQRDYYKQKFGIETTFIPHGFNRPTFSPTSALDIRGKQIDPKKINIVTIGKNYRDFKTLREAISHFADNPRFHFHLVGVPVNEVNEVYNLPNVSYYKRLEDDQFYTLIQNCDYCFLPLSFATANNTILETQSLGVRSILPQIPGVEDYAAPAPLNLYYKSKEELYDVIKNLSKSGINDQLIEYSERFDWKNIFSELNSYYESLLKA